MLALDAKKFRKQRFLQAWCPPDQIQGRGGAIRYRWSGHYDFCFITAYGMLLPKPEADQKHCHALLDWISKVLPQLPAICTPILMMD
eukprot:54806-Pyramimonas_sp.AAC.1